jgi:hypothetical protein
MVEQHVWPANISQFTDHKSAVMSVPSKTELTRISRTIAANQNPATTGPKAVARLVTGKL